MIYKNWKQIIFFTIILVIIVLIIYVFQKFTEDNINEINYPNISEQSDKIYVSTTKQNMAETFEDPATSTTSTTSTTSAEKSDTPDACNNPLSVLKSIINVNYGYIIDVLPSGNNDKSYFLIHYNTETPNTPAGVYSTNNNNELIIQIKNDVTYSQKWYFKKIDEHNVIVSTNSVTYNSANDYIQNNLYVLTFDNTMSGYVLSYRPFNDYPTQKWNTSNDIESPFGKNNIALGSHISSVINSSQISPLNANIDLSNLSLNQDNETKLKSVLDIISSNLQAYKDNTTNSSQKLGKSTDTPLRINLSLSGDTGILTTQKNNIERFNDTNVMELLNKYENYEKDSTSDSVYTLDTAISSAASCPIFDSSEYSLNRIGQCNCNLSDLYNA